MRTTVCVLLLSMALSDDLVKGISFPVERCDKAGIFHRILPNGTCYFFNPHPQPFWKLRHFCEYLSAKPVQIENDHEQTAIVNRMAKILFPGSPWLGITDFGKENCFRFISSNQAITYTNWYDPNPSNSNGNEHCVEMRREKDYRWNDIDCEVKNPVICERRHC